MQLVLCRHGLAMEKDKFALYRKDDSLRPLVAKGRERTEQTAKALRRWDTEFDLIVSSPYLRARQTAEILSQALKVSNVFESQALTPMASPQEFADWLKTHADECMQVLAVGHEPQLSLFASWCLSGQENSFIDLKKSGLISLEVKSFSRLRPGEAQLEYLLSPKHL